jgi:glycosyltransferase involved in cell wall biosynthesis
VKVTHLNYFESSGGAAIAACRLHQGLLAQGIESNLWFIEGKGVVPRSRCLVSPRSRALFRLRKSLAWRLSRALSHDTLRSFSLLPSEVLKQINESDADIVHLHWVNSEMISIPQIARIKQSLVWTFHDIWPICGGQHYADEETLSRHFYCDKTKPFRTSPDSPLIKPKAHQRHLAVLADKALHCYKQWHWRHLKSRIVCPSRWLAGCAKNSLFPCFHSPVVVPNGLDLNVFTPHDKAQCRHEFGLPQQSRIILFGAHNPNDPIKGLHLLRESIASTAWPETCIAAFGADSGPNIGGVPTFWLGAVTDQTVLARVYSAADVLAFPSVRENLPNTIAEALSCGLPTVAFDVGGIPDLVVNDLNGYLVPPYNIHAFGSAIGRALECGVYKRLSLGARERAVDLLDVRLCARRHIELYNHALGA